MHGTSSVNEIAERNSSGLYNLSFTSNYRHPKPPPTPPKKKKKKKVIIFGSRQNDGVKLQES